MIDTFEPAQVDAIAINAAGCGSNMKDYAILLQEDPKYAERARTFSAKCFDISEILARLEPRAPRHPLPLKDAYHDACHLQHAQNVRLQPRALLKSIPGLEIVEVAEAALCCGSAGIYNLIRPEPAKELGQRKLRNLLALSPDVVAAGNPGCVLQLRSEMRLAGKRLPVRHTVELLDAAIQGVAPDSLREPLELSSGSTEICQSHRNDERTTFLKHRHTSRD
jgi:glycolate oxidase iron-sulfur subunit